MRRLRLRLKDERSRKNQSSSPDDNIFSYDGTPLAKFEKSQPWSNQALSYCASDSMANVIPHRQLQISIPSLVVLTSFYSTPQSDSYQPTIVANPSPVGNGSPHRKEGEQHIFHVFVYRKRSRHDKKAFQSPTHSQHKRRKL